MAEKKEVNKKEKKAAKPEKKLFAKHAEKQSDARPSDYAVLLRPVITEKSSIVSSHSPSGPGGTVVFRVHPDSTKDTIREAIERIFKVNVIKVRTANTLGKIKRTAKSSGRRAGHKKAYVTLKEGQTISIVEGL